MRARACLWQHYFGDSVDVTISIEAGSSSQTLSEVGEWRWAHGAKHVHTRVLRGGLIAAVVESWFPTTAHSYGLLLEDDIEASPFFYAQAQFKTLACRVSVDVAT